MDRYHIWCNLRQGVRDHDFAGAVREFLEHMKREGNVAAWGLERRKLGLGPAVLGEWHISIDTHDLNQLDNAFHQIRPREGNLERLHGAVWSRVTDLTYALYRDFPDE